MNNKYMFVCTSYGSWFHIFFKHAFQPSILETSWTSWLSWCHPKNAIINEFLLHGRQLSRLSLSFFSKVSQNMFSFWVSHHWGRWQRRSWFSCDSIGHGHQERMVMMMMTTTTTRILMMMMVMMMMMMRSYDCLGLVFWLYPILGSTWTHTVWDGVDHQPVKLDQLILVKMSVVSRLEFEHHPRYPSS